MEETVRDTKTFVFHLYKIRRHHVHIQHRFLTPLES